MSERLIEKQFLIGLDLGQSKDPTAIAVVERSLFLEINVKTQREHWVTRYEAKHLERSPLGVPYTEIADSVRQLCADEKLKGHELRVLADATGVGRAAVDVLRERVKGLAVVWRITITAGSRVSEDELGGHHVPKKDLVHAALLLLEDGRLKAARGAADLDKLKQEMQTLKIKVTPAANETYEAWREGDHDDLVFALSMPCWYGEHIMSRFKPVVVTHGRDAYRSAYGR